jgi:flagellar basal body-associated protein FliL
MDNWSARRDDIPYHLRAEPRSSSAWIWVLAVLLAAAGGAYVAYQYLKAGPVAPQAEFVPPASTAPAPAAPPQASEEPAIRHPIAGAPEQPEKPLPALEDSDPMMRADLANLMGRKKFAELVYPEHLVRRIVATVDNLPRRTAPGRMMPVQPVAGRFATVSRGDEVAISEKNFARYDAFVRAFEVAYTPTFVRLYVERYPLFQRAYEELGYPGKYFNDRVIVAIDDLLAAPEVAAPIALMKGEVLYQFADPDLETRSAGQKIMIRMGPKNAARVKAKLREIRSELAAAGSP